MIIGRFGCGVRGLLESERLNGLLSVSGPESVRGSERGEKRFSGDIVDAMRVIQNFHTRARTQASTRARLYRLPTRIPRGVDRGYRTQYC